MRILGRRLRFVLAPLTALLIVTTIGATVPVGLPPCNLAATWVAEHLSDIPGTYDEFAKYPSAYRKAMYSKLSPAVKKAMWREQLSRYLRPEANLRPAERKFLQREYDRLDSYFDQATPPAFIKDERLSQHAKLLFGFDRARDIFASLGPWEGTVTTLNVNAASIFGPVSLPAKLTKALHLGKQQPNCSCARGDDWCGGADHCTSGGCVIGGSCGWFGTSNCDGLCYANS